MRVAFISDIHGNFHALEAVLADIEQANVDRIICPGDVITGGVQPRQVLQAIRELDCPVIMGNTDSWVLSPEFPDNPQGDYARMADMSRWTLQQLTDDDLAFVQSFLPHYTFEMTDSVDVCCYHGSPKSFNDVIRPTTPDDEIQPMLAGHEARIMIGGHTHHQMLRGYREMILVNTGSVGLPFIVLEDSAYNPAIAEYAIIDATDTQIHVELRRVTLDIDEVRAVILDSDMPHKEWFADEWKAF